MSRRILVCDDATVITRAIAMKFTRAGYEVETAADGVEGLEAARRNPPDLVVTDLQMPRMDGLELCQQLREDETLAAVPVVLLSAKGFELDEAALRRELGVTRVMVKPFSPRELLTHVEELLEADTAASCDA